MNQLSQKNKEEITRQRFNSASVELYDANMDNNRFDSILQTLLPLVQYSMVGILLWLMTFLSNSIDPNSALVFVLITLMMLSPMKRILKVPSFINRGKISLRKINEIVNSSNSGQAKITAVNDDTDKMITGDPLA